MLILRYNDLPADDLIQIELKMRKIADPHEPPNASLEYTLLDKTRAEIYGMLLGTAERLEVCKTLGISPSEFLDFLIDVDRGYHPNPYHSFFHAADVALVIYNMLIELEVAAYLSRVDVAALYIAGLCHDIGHPGLNNNYQVNMKTDLAKRYANKSVLESYSCTLAMDLLAKHDLLRNVEQSSRKGSVQINEDRLKTSIVKMILATDMVFHYELQENLASLLEIAVDRQEDANPGSPQANSAGMRPRSCGQMKDIFESEISPLQNFESQTYFDDGVPPSKPRFLDYKERQVLCQIVLHAADISNALRPWPICSRWSDLVCVEFFRQGEEEKKHGLKVSPSMDKDQVKQTTIGLQFGDFVVSPYFEIFAAMFPKADVLLKELAKNREEWLKLEEQESQGVHHSPDDFPEDHGCQPTDMLPDQHILNPSGRRVSVAAGMIVIPDDLEERVIGSGKSRRKYLGLRSVSDTGIHHFDPLESQDLERLTHTGPRYRDRNRRRSEEPSYYLYRHKIGVASGRRLSRGDIVDKCLERQRRLASPR
ncbi:hypothetical protein BX666DRAFT_2025451 [Dichotomocladium elegans]|nr:hypothetical protein BX666DRAFT_2025451 [Dichotomocladium elegans]